MTMDTLRQMLTSKTIWGVVILLLNNTILKDSPLAESFGEQASSAITGLLDALGTVLAVWGRMTASGPMVGRPTP